MSYDLRIYTTIKQNYDKLLDEFKLEINDEGFSLAIGKSLILVFNEILIDEEDIPDQINRQLPGIQYLIECSLTPLPNNKKKINEFLKLAKQIALNGQGIIENPQNDAIILPSGVSRIMIIDKTERFSIVVLSWWYNSNVLAELDNLNELIHIIDRNIPEALPQRYGTFEPPQEKFTNKRELISFIMRNLDDILVWYPYKPVIDVDLTIHRQIGPEIEGYRFGHFSIEIDSAVLSMPGWQTLINRVFINIAQLLNPFYSDIRILNYLVRTKNGANTDNLTENHPITGCWWNDYQSNPA